MAVGTPSIICVQPVSLVVESTVAGIDFSTLVWGAEQNNGGGCATSAGGTYSGAIAHMNVSVPNGCNDGWFNHASMSVLYTGPTQACQVKITCTFTGGNGTNKATVFVYQDGVLIFSQQAINNGLTTFNYNINAGTNSQIAVGLAGIDGIGVACDLADFPGPNFNGLVTFEFLPHS